MREADLASALSKGGPVLLANARLPAPMAPDGLPVVGDGLVAADLLIDGTRMDLAAPGQLAAPAAERLDLAQAMVWALPVDCHTHIDKGQVWARTANPDGTFDGAMTAASEEAEAHFSADDMAARARFILDCALAHGTGALRSHIDAGRSQFDTRFAVLREVAGDYADRMPVQLAPFTGLGEGADFVTHIAGEAARHGTGILSAFLYRDAGLTAFVDVVFGLAIKYGLALDFHADETLDPESHCTRAVAEAALRHRFDGPILIGHACALSVQPPDELARTADLLAQSNITVVALPLCNSYLQDRRRAESPRQRGIAPLHELAAHGVPVALASDNVRDPFHAYGDMDVSELFRFSVHAMHLDHPVGDWPATISTTPATAMGRPDLGRLTTGGPADLMILPARNWSEFTARPTRRIVLRGGAVQDSTPPNFSRLDRLKGMTP